MSDYEKLRKQAEELRIQYPVGTRIELIQMGNDPCPVPNGTRGEVKGVDDFGSILMKWDNGSSLSLIIGEDNFKVISQKEEPDHKSAEKSQEPEMSM